MNDLHLAGYAPPTAEQFEELLGYQIRDRGHTYDIYDMQMKAPGLENHAVDVLAANAAQVALSDWSPEEIELARELGRKGGQVSRRGPSKATAENLGLLAAMPPGTPNAQAAAQLEVSLSTITRLRRELRRSSE